LAKSAVWQQRQQRTGSVKMFSCERGARQIRSFLPVQKALRKEGFL